MRVHDLLAPLAFDEQHEVFILKDGYLGMLFEANPMFGADDSRANMFRSALQIGFAPGTFIQFCLLTLPSAAPYFLHYTQDRLTGLDALKNNDTKSILTEFYKKRIDFLDKGIDEPLLPSYGQLVHDTRLLIAVKTPFKKQVPTKKEFSDFVEVANKFRDALQSAGIYASAIGPGRYGLLINSIFDPAKRPVEPNISETLTIDESVAQPGTDLVVHFDHMIANGRTKIKVLGVKALPPSASLSLGFLMQGDYLGQNNQMQCPYMITLSLHFPQQGAKIADMKRKSLIANYQAFGPLMKFIPRLAMKKNNMDIIISAIEDGEALFEAALQVVLFSQDHEKVDTTSAVITTYYSSLGLQMAEEKRILLPAFFNALPLNPTQESIKNLFRYSTMAASHAVALLPVVSDWRGNANKGCAMLHVSRRGQIAAFDLYDSMTNYNGVVFAESGSGKSFFTQDLIVNYLSKGAKVWVIDVGRSYYKLAKVLKGEFIEFTEDSGICLNPFTHIENIDDETGVLQAIIEKMAAPVDGLDDYRYSRIEEGLKAVWGSMGNNATITEVAQYFVNHADPRIQDIGAQLFSYTRLGSMGFWFDGHNNLDLGNDFVVLELEELKSRRQLQQIILMLIISNIQREMYLSQDNRPKILIIDEAWDLLDDKIVGKFIEHAYRRFRKYGGSAIVVTQSIADLYQSPSGRAIAANSAFKFVLKQNSESIIRIQEEKLMMGPKALFSQMQTVHTVPGKYSEFMVITDGGFGIFRLIVDRFTQVLYSTAPHERAPIINAIQSGVPPLEAINRFIAENG